MISEEEVRQDIIGFLDLSMKTGRCSTLLLDQLTHGVLSRTLHSHSVYDAIRDLEFNQPEVMTKPAKPLSRRLNGLWHKHYFQPAFLVKNIINSIERLTDDELNKIVPPPDLSEEKRIGYISHSIIFSALEKRVRKQVSDKSKITGEWIVFAKTPTGNIYLTLANHGQDEATIACLQTLKNEFPDVPELQALI